MRPPFLLGLTAAGLILFSSPASAKAFGLESLTITGPAVEDPVTLTGEQFGIPDNEDHPSAVALEGMLGRFEKQAEPPPGDLGRRYRLEYRLGLSALPNRKPVVVQYLYPEAEGGPVTFTPSGQSMKFSPGDDDPEIPWGWQPFPEALVSTLQRHGLPGGSAAGPKAVSGEGSVERLPAPLLGVGLVVLLLTLTGLRRFRERDPASELIHARIGRGGGRESNPPGSSSPPHSF